MAVSGGVVLVLAGLFLGWVFLQFLRFERASRPVLDVGEYERVLGEWKEFAGDIVWHFPEAVPGDAEDAGFYYWPGLYQSDARIELRVRVGAEEMEQYYEAFSGRATKLVRGAALTHFVRGRGEVDVVEPGDDYVVMHFDAEAEDIAEHGKQHGVIMSREKKEIIFWAEW